MLYGCLFDILRFALLGLAFVCVLLFGATIWVGPDYGSIIPVTIDPDVQYDVHVRGPSPDFDVAVVRHVLFRETFELVATIHLRAVPLAFTTILLAIVTWVLDWYSTKQQPR